LLTIVEFLRGCLEILQPPTRFFLFPATRNSQPATRFLILTFFCSHGQVVQDQTVKMVVAGLEKPAQVHETIEAVGITPGITGKPGILHGGFPEIKTTGGGGKTSDPVHDTGGICKGMGMLPGDLYSLIHGSDNMRTTPANDEFLFLLFFFPFLLQLLGHLLELFIAVFP
jgi:hypothetical protein